MSKKEFLDTLHQLLASLPTEERLSAVKYYEEYFEEAGPQQEAAILAELGTPQSIADALLRDYSGVPGTARQVAEDQAKAAASEKKESSSQRTEQKASGYQYNYQYDYQYGQQGQQASSQTTRDYDSNERPWYKQIPIWAWVLIGLFGWPVIGAIGGLLATLLSVVFTIILVAICLMAVGVLMGIAICIAGIALLVAGCLLIPISSASALLMLGVGLSLLAIGILVTFFGARLTARWTPGAIAWFSNLCRRIWAIFTKKREGNVG